jgi:hypothetical protein
MSGEELATFFFLVCLIIPVIKKPSFIGVDTDPSYALDDLANMFFFTHFSSLVPPPPLVFSMLKICRGPSFHISALISDLIRSSRPSSDDYSSEFRESNFASVIPSSSKTALVLPLDLFELHTSAVVARHAGSDLLTPDALVQFDYLLGAPPDLDPTRQYEIFGLELTLPRPDDPPPSSSLPREVRESFASLFRSASPQLFESSPIESAIAFLSADRALANAATVCLSHVSSLLPFLEAENARSVMTRRAQSSLAVETRLGFGELSAALQRTGRLSQKVFCAANKLQIRLLVRSYMFEELSSFDANVERFARRLSAFCKFSQRVIGTFWRIVGERHASVYRLRRADFAEYLSAIVFCVIVNWVPLERFMAVREDVKSDVGKLLDPDRWRPVKKLAMDAQALMRHPMVLEREVETLSRAFESENYATMLHLALRSVEVVASAVRKDVQDQRAVVMRALCWIVTHEDMDRFMKWRFFMFHFFPKSERLVDIVGGLDVANWGYFEEIFGIIIKQERKVNA